MPKEQSVAGGVAAFGKNSLSRREFVRLGGAGLAGVVLLGASGCGGESKGSRDLNFAYWPDTGGVQKLIDKFNKQKKGKVQVIYREIPQAPEVEADFGHDVERGYFDTLKADFRLRDSTIDVTAADIIWTAEFAENDWILDISNRFSESEQSTFLNALIQALTYERKIYAVPWSADAGLLYYRKDLLEKNGFSEPPKTWEELKEMAGKVVQDSSTRFGFVFQGANYEGGVCNGLEFVWTHGGQVIDPNDSNKVIIDSPESIVGLKTEQSMISEGVAPPSVANYTESESETTFLNGDAVFCRNWPYMYALAVNPDSSKLKPEQVGVSSIPVGEGQSQTASCLGGEGILINASSQMQDQAWEFVDFISNEKSQKMRLPFKSPTLKTLYEDREVREAMPVVAWEKDALQNARSRPVSPHYSEMSRTMAEQFNDVLRGATSPEEAVERLQGELQQIIEEGR